MKIIDCIQGSPEWWTARRGIPSASNFSRIITQKTMKLSAQHDDYIAELIADVACLGSPTPTFTPASQAMINGQNTEPEARRWFEMEQNVDVRQVGLCITDDGHFCCSPDGLIGEESGLELKCPLLKTHARYLMNGGLPDEHKAQTHGNLLVTARKFWWFCSYAPGLEPLLVRVEPDEFTEALRSALDQFHIRYQTALAKFVKKQPEKVVQDAPGSTRTPQDGSQSPDLVQVDVTAAWQSWLDADPNLEAFNSKLPELSQIVSKATKIEVWARLTAFAEKCGLAFDREAKIFKRKP